MKYFVADSFADGVHERDIPIRIVDGLPFVQAVLVIDAHDSYEIDGDKAVKKIPDHREYTEKNGCAVLKVSLYSDHWYAIVFNPDDYDAARRVAHNILDDIEDEYHEGA